MESEKAGKVLREAIATTHQVQAAIAKEAQDRRALLESQAAATGAGAQGVGNVGGSGQ